MIQVNTHTLFPKNHEYSETRYPLKIFINETCISRIHFCWCSPLQYIMVFFLGGVIFFFAPGAAVQPHVIWYQEAAVFQSCFVWTCSIQLLKGVSVALAVQVTLWLNPQI